MKFGIIGAMDLETDLLIEKMAVTSKETIAQLTFYSGKIHDREVVVVTSGIGKVNAAVCTQILISTFGVEAVVNTGVSGAVHSELNIGDIVISTDCVEHDFDCTAFGYAPGTIPRMALSQFPADTKLVDLAYKASLKVVSDQAVYKGRVASGDQFVNTSARRTAIDEAFQAYTTEMEGAAIAHTCYLSQVPFVIIRAMSDKADGTAHENFDAFSRQAAATSSRIVEGLLLSN